MAVSGKLSALDIELVDASAYPELDGSLFEMEICLPIGLWTWFMSKPYKTHWQTGFCGLDLCPKFERMDRLYLD